MGRISFNDHSTYSTLHLCRVVERRECSLGWNWYKPTTCNIVLNLQILLRSSKSAKELSLSGFFGLAFSFLSVKSCSFGLSCSALVATKFRRCCQMSYMLDSSATSSLSLPKDNESQSRKTQWESSSLRKRLKSMSWLPEWQSSSREQSKQQRRSILSQERKNAGLLKVPEFEQLNIPQRRIRICCCLIYFATCHLALPK